MSSPDNAGRRSVSPRAKKKPEVKWEPDADEAARLIMAEAAQDLGVEAERIARYYKLKTVHDVHVTEAAANIRLRVQSPVSGICLALGSLLVGAALGFAPGMVAAAPPLWLLVAVLVGGAAGIALFTVGVMLALRGGR